MINPSKLGAFVAVSTLFVALLASIGGEWVSLAGYYYYYPGGGPVPTNIRFEPANARAPLGGQVSVNLVAAIPPAMHLGAWTVDTSLSNPGVAHAVACTSDLVNATTQCNTNYQNSGIIRVTGASSDGLTGTVTLATITLHADGPQNGSTTLDPVVVTFADVDFHDEPTTTTSGMLTIGPRCDADGDGDVDSVDALKVLRIVVGFDQGSMDVDGDGDTDAVDALKVLRYVVGFTSPC
jgi:hypothetical protein